MSSSTNNDDGPDVQQRLITDLRDDGYSVSTGVTGETVYAQLHRDDDHVDFFYAVREVTQKLGIEAETRIEQTTPTKFAIKTQENY